MAGTIALTPFSLATSASLVKSTLPKGTVVFEHARPCPRRAGRTRRWLSAARLEDGEMPYP